MVARGANMLPTAVVQKAMRPLYGGPLNFVAFSKAVERLDKWYQDRGILGQVGTAADEPSAATAQLLVHTHHDLVVQLHKHCNAPSIHFLLPSLTCPSWGRCLVGLAQCRQAGVVTPRRTIQAPLLGTAVQGKEQEQRLLQTTPRCRWLCWNQRANAFSGTRLSTAFFHFTQLTYVPTCACAGD